VDSTSPCLQVCPAFTASTDPAAFTATPAPAVSTTTRILPDPAAFTASPAPAATNIFSDPCASGIFPSAFSHTTLSSDLQQFNTVPHLQQTPSESSDYLSTSPFSPYSDSYTGSWSRQCSPAGELFSRSTCTTPDVPNQVSNSSTHALFGFAVLLLLLVKRTCAILPLQDFIMFRMSDQLLSLRREMSHIQKDVEELKMNASKKSRERVCLLT